VAYQKQSGDRETDFYSTFFCLHPVPWTMAIESMQLLPTNHTALDNVCPSNGFTTAVLVTAALIPRRRIVHRRPIVHRRRIVHRCRIVPRRRTDLPPPHFSPPPHCLPLPHCLQPPHFLPLSRCSTAAAVAHCGCGEQYGGGSTIRRYG